MTPLSTTLLPTPIGVLTLVASAGGLRAVIFESERRERRFDAELVDDPTHPVLVEAVDQLGAYFTCDLAEFDLPLELVGTEFQQLAWRALATISYGETVSYAEQARRVGRPSAARAIGAANGRNPVPVVLPCHRVIGANGSLTGFGGGVDTKAELLDFERRRVLRLYPPIGVP